MPRRKMQSNAFDLHGSIVKSVQKICEGLSASLLQHALQKNTHAINIHKVMGIPYPVTQRVRLFLYIHI